MGEAVRLASPSAATPSAASRKGRTGGWSVGGMQNLAEAFGGRSRLGFQVDTGGLELLAWVSGRYWGLELLAWA